MYKTIGIDSVGKYVLSTIPGSKASNWSPSKGTRFKDFNTAAHDVPPPGTYNPTDKESATGSYILSTTRN